MGVITGHLFLGSAIYKFELYMVGAFIFRSNIHLFECSFGPIKLSCFRNPFDPIRLF
jgi:hypothetical protein